MSGFNGTNGICSDKTEAKLEEKFPLLSDQQHYLRKRGLIEPLNDLLVSVSDPKYPRHRKPENAFAHIVAVLVVYQFLGHKLSNNIPVQQISYSIVARFPLF